MAAPLPPPGWYPDPSGAPGQRYWDGKQWASEPNPPLQEANKQSPVLRGSLIVVGIVGVVVVVVAVVILARQVSQSFPGFGSTATPTVTISSDPTQQLVGMAPSGDNCTPTTNAPRSSGAEVAEIVCENPSSLSSLMYFLFPDSSALQSWISKTPAGGFQSCPGRQQGPQPWHRAANPQQTEGMVACYSSNRRPTVAWSENSQLLGGVAVGGSIDQAYQWWAAQHQ